MTVLLAFLLYAIGLSVALGRVGYRHSSREAAVVSEASMDQPRRVLIVGATGASGRQLVMQALERGHTVTAFARDPKRLEIEHAHLTVVQGDVLDPASVETAMRGQEVVVSALGHKRFFYPTRILSEGTRNILRAMEGNGVSRLVNMTSLGIGDTAWRTGVSYTFFVLPLILPFYFWDKARQERIIAASAADWVIVRPGALTNGPKRGRLRHGPRVGSFLWTVRISRADVAAFMLDQVGSDAHVRNAVGVCS